MTEDAVPAVDPGEVKGEIRSRPSRLAAGNLSRLGGIWVAIGVLMLVFAVANPGFAAPENLLGLVRAASSLGIVALGLTLVIIASEVDLSIGSIYGFAAILLAALWITRGLSFYLALPIAMAVSCAIGILNGLMVIRLRVPSFVVTLGTLSIVSGASFLLSGGKYLSAQYANPPVPASELPVFSSLGATTLPGGIPIQIAWLAVASVVFWVLLHRSLFGFRLMAIGGNVDAARSARLRVGRYKVIVFGISGLMAGIAGILDFSFLGATQPSSGAGLTFPVFAAVIIGGTSLAGGRGSVLGTLTGAMLLAVLSNGLALIGAAAGAQLVFTGTITIAAVALDKWFQPGPDSR